MKKYTHYFNNFGEIIFKKNGVKSKGSAFILFNGEDAVISTAAHCIFDWHTNNFYEEIFFKGCDRKKIKIKEAYLHKSWTMDSIVDYDTAFLIPEKIDINKLILIDPIFFEGGCQNYYLLYKKSRGIRKKSLNFINKKSFNNNKNSMIGLNVKLKNGDSGSPWLIKIDDKFYQHSNSSMSFTDNEKIIWGPVWGKEIKKIYDSAILQTCLGEKIIKGVFNYE